MSDHSMFGFGVNGVYKNRCTLCLSEDDTNMQSSTASICQHTANVESALHYLRNNYGSPISDSPYGLTSVPYRAQNIGSTINPLMSTFGTIGNSCVPPVLPNYYTLAEFLLRLNRLQQENSNSNSGHRVRPQPMSSRPSKHKSDMGCLRECAFCKSNGETAEFYKSHFLKDPVGRVRCPILQRYDCSL